MKDNADFAAAARAMAAIDFCMFNTTAGDGSPRTRPMSNNGQIEYDGDNWFFSHRRSRKVEEIQGDDHVLLTFADPAGPSFIAVDGRALVLDDAALKRRHWLDELRKWFPNGPDDPDVVLIKVRARHLRTWGRIGDIEMDLPRA